MRNQNSLGNLNPPRPVKKSSDQRITLILISFVLFSAFTLTLATLLRVNLEHKLQSTIQELETVQVENDSLWNTILALQTENEELSAEYKAMLLLWQNQEPETREICSTSTFKSWMDYRAITSRSSKQYQYQLEATTDKNYGFRMIDGNILVAMGPQYGPVGSKYIIQFEDGKVINAMIGDIKHQGCTSSDGSMIEFIVDSKVLPKSIKSSGDFNQLFNGSIAMIKEVNS
ncbi:MAG: hypothetical protein AB9921_06080 [Erysipelotrichaceae bacterium]